ncbi:MAG: COQ9 family protein [Dongiaceae bacterium]
MVKTRDRDQLREALFEATLGHVPFDGWSQTAFNAAVKELGADPALALNEFPGGMAELLEFYHRRADQLMVEELQRRDIMTLKVRERIALAVRTRLVQNARHREAIRQALSFLAMPQNAPLGARCLYRTVDAIWYAAGDTSTDFSFYTKRGLLAGVYGATVLFWLNDKSDDFVESWAFLDRRIADVMKIQQWRRRLDKLAEKLPDPFRILRAMARR